MDAIKLLMQDHRTVEALFKRFERAGKKAFKAKQAITKEIIRELAIHTAIEELFLYPTARHLSEHLGDLALEALEEHHVAKATLAELDRMKATDERYEAKVTVLMENIRHHVQEEQQHLFPQMRKVLSAADLNALGDAMAKAKKVAPTHPHPMAPDSPPGNFITHALAKIIDAGRDLFGSKAQSAERLAASSLRSLDHKTRRAERIVSSSVRAIETKARTATRSAVAAPPKRRSVNGHLAARSSGQGGRHPATHETTMHRR